MDNETLYRPSGKVKDTNRTYVPDLYRQVVAEMQEELSNSQGSVPTPEKVIHLQSRPLVGVLFSISSGIDGELFPVYVGRNTIGSDPTCDICLRETSVSALHGLILTRKQTDERGQEYINVILSDNNSTCGTKVNDEIVCFDNVTCSNGDIITIGQNYVLMLSLFNALGKLSVSYGFDRISEPEKREELTPQTASEQMSNSIEMGEPAALGVDHSANITKDTGEDFSDEMYHPSRHQLQDHYNNKTIIL